MTNWRCHAIRGCGRCEWKEPPPDPIINDRQDTLFLGEFAYNPVIPVRAELPDDDDIGCC